MAILVGGDDIADEGRDDQGPDQRNAAHDGTDEFRHGGDEVCIVCWFDTKKIGCSAISKKIGWRWQGFIPPNQTGEGVSIIPLSCLSARWILLLVTAEVGAARHDRANDTIGGKLES